MKAVKIRRIDEVCESCGITEDLLYQFIELEWITPLDSANKIFDEEDVARVQLIRELKDQLGVNEEAMPIILSLIDQLNFLHHKLRSL